MILLDARVVCGAALPADSEGLIWTDGSFASRWMYKWNAFAAGVSVVRHHHEEGDLDGMAKRLLCFLLNDGLGCGRMRARREECGRRGE